MTAVVDSCIRFSTTAATNEESSCKLNEVMMDGEIERERGGGEKGEKVGEKTVDWGGCRCTVLWSTGRIFDILLISLGFLSLAVVLAIIKVGVLNGVIVNIVNFIIVVIQVVNFVVVGNVVVVSVGIACVVVVVEGE